MAQQKSFAAATFVYKRVIKEEEVVRAAAPPLYQVAHNTGGKCSQRQSYYSTRQRRYAGARIRSRRHTL